MLTNTKTGKTLFLHIVKKIETEKSELLNSVNKEITRKRDSYRKNPIVYVLYRIPSDKLYKEYWNVNVTQELRFASTADILVLKVPVKNHKALSMEQFEKIINKQFSKLNQVLLRLDSVKISDNVSLDDYFDSLKK